MDIFQILLYIHVSFGCGHVSASLGLLWYNFKQYSVSYSEYKSDWSHFDTLKFSEFWNEC